MNYERDKRYAGKTKYSLKSMIPYALDSITGVSVEPLRMTRIPVWLSLLILLSSLVFLIVAPSELWKAAAVLALLLSFFSTMIFISVAVIAEYAAQTFIETKGRPIFMVEQYIPPEKEEG